MKIYVYNKIFDNYNIFIFKILIVVYINKGKTKFCLNLKKKNTKFINKTKFKKGGALFLNTLKL